MKAVIWTLLLASTFFQSPSLDVDAAERKIYFFCHSRLVDVKPGDKQHIVITKVYSKTVNDQQLWEIVTEWKEFVETDFEKNVARTSDLNHYNTLEEAQAHLEQQLAKDLKRHNTEVETVSFEF